MRSSAESDNQQSFLKSQQSRGRKAAESLGGSRRQNARATSPQSRGDMAQSQKSQGSQRRQQSGHRPLEFDGPANEYGSQQSQQEQRNSGKNINEELLDRKQGAGMKFFKKDVPGAKPANVKGTFSFKNSTGKQSSKNKMNSSQMKDKEFLQDS